MNNVPSEIARDCSVDVADRLNAWIRSVPDGSTLTFGVDACYNVDGGLVVDDRSHLTFEGNGATFAVFSADVAHAGRSNWLVRGGDRIVLRNMVVRGSNRRAGINDGAFNTSLTYQHGYVLEGVHGAVLERVQAYDVYGDFVLVRDETRRPFPGRASKQITVRQGRFERNGRQGIALTHVDGFVLESSYLNEVNQSAIDIELDEDSTSYPRCTGSCSLGRNISILHNTFGRIRHALIANAGMGARASVGNVTVVGNVMTSAPYNCSPPVWVVSPRAASRWSGYIFKGNTLVSYGSGFDITGVENVTLRGNVVKVFPGGGCGRNAAFQMRHVTRADIQSNHIFSGLPGYSLLESDARCRGILMQGNELNKEH